LKTVKVSVTLPEDLLREIKAMTDNVSAFVAAGVQQYVDKERLRRALLQSAGAWSEEDHPELRKIEEVAEYVRKTRSRWKPDEER